jgi:hypothetical protein
MIFRGTPGMAVVVTRPRNGEPRAIRFDKNGLYETHIASMIRRMAGKFERVDAEDAAEPAPAPQEPQEQEPQPEPAQEPSKGVVCAICGERFENNGKRLAHCRKDHRK